MYTFVTSFSTEVGKLENNDNTRAMFLVLSLWNSHCESLLGSFQGRLAPDGRHLVDQTRPANAVSMFSGVSASLDFVRSTVIFLTQHAGNVFEVSVAMRELSRNSLEFTAEDMINVLVSESRVSVRESKRKLH